MIERDYIMRMTQQLAAVVARLFKLREQEEYDLAFTEIDRACGELLGLEPPVIARFDSATLAQLLGHPEKMKALATLFLEQAELHHANREPDQAHALHRRALELYIEAMLSQPTNQDECRERIQRLLGMVEVNRLAAKYVEALRRFGLVPSN